MRLACGRRMIALLTAAAVGAAGNQAAAQTPVVNWSITGAGCVPTGQTAAGVGTFNSGGDVAFPEGRVGELIVTCPVPSTVRRASRLSVTFRDTDGPGNAVRLRAALRQKGLQAGGVSDVGNAVLDSNLFVASNQTRRAGVQIANACGGPLFAFDTDNFTYYIQVNMTRRQASHQVLLASVELDIC